MDLLGKRRSSDGYRRVPRGPRPWHERVRARVRWLRLWHVVVLLLVLIAGYALIARHRGVVPGGDVLAVVDDTPVTGADVAAEARAVGLPPEQLDAAARKAMLQRVIARRLLAAAARAQGVERNAAFVADRARGDEMMLAGAIARRFAGGTDDADAASVRRYMAANPAMFAARETIMLDAVTADFSAIPKATLAAFDTIGDATSYLNATKQPFAHGTQRVDSATLPAELARELARVKPGALFIVPGGARSVAGTVIARTPNIRPPAEQLATARAAVGRQRAQARVDAAVAALKAKARISYAAGVAG